MGVENTSKKGTGGGRGWRAGFGIDRTHVHPGELPSGQWDCECGAVSTRRHGGERIGQEAVVLDDKRLESAFCVLVRCTDGQ